MNAFFANVQTIGTVLLVVCLWAAILLLARAVYRRVREAYTWPWAFAAAVAVAWMAARLLAVVAIGVRA